MEPRNQEKPMNVAQVREERERITNMYVQEVGHPLYTLTKENEGLKTLIKKAKEAINEGRIDKNLIGGIREIAIHYAKKGDLLYPHLKVKYEISGPSDVMWTTDDEYEMNLRRFQK